MCLVHKDDVIVFSENEEEHFDNIENVLSLLDDTGVKMKLG